MRHYEQLSNQEIAQALGFTQTCCQHAVSAGYQASTCDSG
ncbi:MAG: hypothetical protein U0905_16850 [Pirellulales bacterium]